MSMLRLPLYAPQGPSLARAGALSGAMTVNLLVIGALLLPAVVDVTIKGPKPPAEPTLMIARVVEAAAAVVVPAPAPAPPRPAAPLPRAPAAAPATPIPVSVASASADVNVNAAATENAVPSAVPTETVAAVASPSSVAGEATLAYLDAPQPTYPAIAMRKGWQGVVLLRVRVGADGRPVSVEVARSSGHAVLDAAARRQVLARWRFQPALRDGVAVEAIGLVPLAFTLGRG
jgi:protein TonB